MRQLNLIRIKINNLCNKVVIKPSLNLDSPDENEVLISWLDIKTELGFTRELNDTKYFYDKNNKIYNFEKIFSNKNFKRLNKFDKYDLKIGTIDL